MNLKVRLACPPHPEQPRTLTTLATKGLAAPKLDVEEWMITSACVCSAVR